MIYQRIRQLREIHGLSQSDLARRLDVTRSSVHAWESGLSTPTDLVHYFDSQNTRQQHFLILNSLPFFAIMVPERQMNFL